MSTYRQLGRVGRHNCGHPSGDLPPAAEDYLCENDAGERLYTFLSCLEENIEAGSDLEHSTDDENEPEGPPAAAWKAYERPLAVKWRSDHANCAGPDHENLNPDWTTTKKMLIYVHSPIYVKPFVISPSKKPIHPSYIKIIQFIIQIYLLKLVTLSAYWLGWTTSCLSGSK